MERCHEMSQCTPTIAQVTAATEHQTYQGTLWDGIDSEIADTHLPLPVIIDPHATTKLMSIRSRKDFEKLRAIGRIVRETFDRTSAAVRPGITTEELDRIGADVLAQHHAEAAPPKVYGFPGALCISVNDEAIHGIPGGRMLQAGDLVKLDLVAEKDGYFADAAVTVAVGEVSSTASELARCAESAFRRGTPGAGGQSDL